MADIQIYRAYQKLPNVFVNTKKSVLEDKKARLTGRRRKEFLQKYCRNVGMGFKTPKEAIEGKYVDRKCPFTGNVRIRGKIMKGIVMKMKMQRTIVIRRDYLHFVPKYHRFEKRHKNMSVHLSPCFRLVFHKSLFNSVSHVNDDKNDGLPSI